MNAETKVFASQCKIRKGHEGRRNYDMHKVVGSAKILEFFSNICLLRVTILISWTLWCVCAANDDTMYHVLVYKQFDARCCVVNLQINQTNLDNQHI